jgi:hypothetical protein
MQAAVVEVRALRETIQLLARLVALVVPGQHGRKMVWTTQAVAEAVVNNPPECLLAVPVVEVTEETTQAPQPTQLPEP